MSAAAHRRYEYERRMIALRNHEEAPPLHSLQFDNSGQGRLYVPGLAGVPVDLELPPDQRFAHGAHDWAQPRITARELAMLRLINQLTDLPGWHAAILDDEDAERLRPDPWAAPLISNAAWAWCVAELRDKAALFRPNRFVSIFDSACCVVKSDVLITRQLLDWFQILLQPIQDEVKAKFPEELSVNETDEARARRLQNLGNEIARLGDLGCDEESILSGYGIEPPLTAEKLPPRRRTKRPLRLIDPSSFPLVYGKTKILLQGGHISKTGATDTIGMGREASIPSWGELDSVEQLMEPIPAGAWPGIGSSWRGDEDAKPYLYSHRVQWLPCEVCFAGAAADSVDVRITSYINNLHPTVHKELYSAIEQVISQSIQPWNEVLVRRDAYQKPLRIRTYGVEWQPPYPDWAWDLPAWDEMRDAFRPGREPIYNDDIPLIPAEFREDDFDERSTMIEDKVRRLLSLPEPWIRSLSDPSDSARTDSAARYALRLESSVRMKHSVVRTSWQHPEPGAAYSYEEWKAGRADFAVIPPKFYRRDNMANKPEFQIPPRPVSLQTDFRAAGLQVIVRLTSIELEPGADIVDWTGMDSLDNGMLNEHIVATTIVCLSSNNVLPCSISLEVEADLNPRFFHYDDWHDLEELQKVFEVESPHRLGRGAYNDPALQHLGIVHLPVGRLLAFPSVLRRFRPRKLEPADPSKPGRLQMLILHLVDPHYRICSTRNVPPQQQDWWAAAAGLDRALSQVNGGRGLPREVANQIWSEVGGWPMSAEEVEQAQRMRREDEQVYNIAVARGVSTYTFEDE